MKIQEVQNLNNINGTTPTQASKLRYGLGAYAQPRVQKDLFALTNNNLVKKNPVEVVYEKFLSKYNPDALMNRYLTEDSVNAMLEKAPVVSQLLEEKGVKAVACLDNMKNIRNSHIATTVQVAVSLAEEMNLSKDDKQAVALGSLFHDFGKIMMPAEILNKNGMLSPDERAIINTHSRIGYEMLKTTGMNSKALSIVRNHHTAASMTNDKLSKIVSVADVYSALTEKRSYKETMSNEDALCIMKSFVEQGKLDGEIVSVLENKLQNQNNQEQAA